MAEDNNAVLDAIDQLEGAADALAEAAKVITDPLMKAKLAENLPKLQVVIDSLNEKAPGTPS